ncbi:MAG: hypothetical protein JWO06_3158 [Bacteroidota bacterium]|nr:hypothetical protein [Bacteroidota bacterium]
MVALLIAVAVSGVAIYFCNKAVNEASGGKLYSDPKAIPYNKVGLLLGTSKLLADGRDNPYYVHRITATVQLIKEGKIKYVIVSGDNSRKNYNEPEEMRDDLIKQGVDSTVIYLDYAGFRTFDSMVRLREIFSQDSCTIISQEFHNERALYIASREGISAIGFNAADVKARYGGEHFREKFARVKVFLDYMFGKKPKFLGQKVAIPA